MIIIGAGMAGLLAGNLLSRHKPTIFEKQPSLPNNHSAVLRFRSSIVGDTLNIPFKEVNMIKANIPWKNPVADALAYSYKNTNVYKSDRSITAGLVSEKRYIAPSNLIACMAEGLDIKYGLNFDFYVKPKDISEPVISTLPLPVLAKLLGYKETIETTSTPAVNIRAKVQDCDAYVSLMIADPYSPITRVSITGNELIIETNRREIPDINGWVEQFCQEARGFLGLKWTDHIKEPTAHLSTYAKINPIDDDLRKRFMSWATREHNIYSLGRFATWRPKLLMDDLVNDIRRIEKFIEKGHTYS